MSFRRQLVILRKKSGFTQQMMADKLGIHVSQLKRYKAGTSQPTLEVFRKIILALNVSADVLLFGGKAEGLTRIYGSILKPFQSWIPKKKP